MRGAIARVHRDEWARVVATIARRYGDLDIAEEASAEAFALAVEHWAKDGVPPNPGGWLTTTANRRAIDRLRRDARRHEKEGSTIVMDHNEPPGPSVAIDDDRLRLIFTCCHPALAVDARVALTLRLVGGLTTAEIARAFLVPEPTLAQCVTRAKAKIKATRIPYRVPPVEDLPDRLDAVLVVLYLIYNEGYLSTGGTTDSLRDELTAEAIRLTRLVRSLLPDVGEVAGLLALMLLIEARRAARLSPSGILVALPDQDRGAWDASLANEGLQLVRDRLALAEAPGRYQLLAAINAVHVSAASASETDWWQIVALYDQLVALDPSPIVALNRAVALAELDGPQVGLAAIDRLATDLDGYHAYHVARADLLRRLGRAADARAAYDRAIALSANAAEVAYLTRRRSELA